MEPIMNMNKRKTKEHNMRKGIKDIPSVNSMIRQMQNNAENAVADEIYVWDWHYAVKTDYPTLAMICCIQAGNFYLNHKEHWDATELWEEPKNKMLWCLNVAYTFDDWAKFYYVGDLERYMRKMFDKDPEMVFNMGNVEYEEGFQEGILEYLKQSNYDVTDSWVELMFRTISRLSGLISIDGEG